MKKRKEKETGVVTGFRSGELFMHPAYNAAKTKNPPPPPQKQQQQQRTVYKSK